MALYLQSAAHLRSPDTARYHAQRIGQWIEGRRASEAKIVAASIIRDMKPHYAAATINRSLSALREGLKIAFELGHTSQHYGAAIHRLPERNARHVSLTLAQVQKLADAAPTSMRAYLWIAVFTGLRRGEIVALEAEDVQRDIITVRAGNTKTLKMRTVPIIPAVRPWLKMVPLGLDVEGVKSGFRRAREKAGMPQVQFRDLRRSCGSLLVQQGVDIFVVAKILGHSSVRVTEEHYAHLQVKQMRAGLNKLQDLHRELHRRRPKRAASA